MLGKVSVIQSDKKAVFIKFENPCKFKMGETVNVSNQKRKRTLKQNAFYWVFLTWLIHPYGGDLQSQGHFSVDALHEDIKAWITMTHKHDFDIRKRFSTAELDQKQFRKFFDLVNQELMVDILGVDTSGFWKEYEKYSRWVEYNSEDFQAYMDEQQAMPF